MTRMNEITVFNMLKKFVNSLTDLCLSARLSKNNASWLRDAKECNKLLCNPRWYPVCTPAWFQAHCPPRKRVLDIVANCYWTDSVKLLLDCQHRRESSLLKFTWSLLLQITVFGISSDEHSLFIAIFPFHFRSQGIV